MSLLGPASHWLVQVHTWGIVPLRAQAQSCPPPCCGISTTLGASGVQLVGCGLDEGEAQVSRQMETSEPGAAKVCTRADSGWALTLPQARVAPCHGWSPWAGLTMRQGSGFSLLWPDRDGGSYPGLASGGAEAAVHLQPRLP